MIPIEQVLGSAATIASSRVEGEGPEGRLPLTAEMLRHEPSGNIFGLTQNVGMGWRPDALGGAQYVIVSTMGGVRSDHGEPIALGYHTGHWEIGLLVRGAADALRANGAIPFAVYCSDPCDGAKMVSLARIGNYEVRMLESSQDDADAAPLFSIELFDHDAQSPVERCSCWGIDEGAAALRDFISR